MKKLLKILIVISCIGFSTPLLAQEKNNVTVPFVISKEPKMKLKTGAKIAIFLNGNDVLLTRISEDALSIHLANAGFVPVNREKLEKIMGEHVIQKKKEKSEGAINALEIGKAVSAESIIMGTIIMEATEQTSLLVKIASFQLVDIASEKTLVNLLYESEKGQGISVLTEHFVNILKQQTE